MPEDQGLIHEPKDEKLVSAVEGFVAKRGAPPNSDYDFVRTDLNGDGKREGIVLFKLPHTYWCGWDGCGMAVFRADDDDFTPVATMSGIRGPIHVAREASNGWRDIIVEVSGARMPNKNVVLEFDGSTYPNSPMLAQTLHSPVSSLKTDRFFR